MYYAEGIPSEIVEEWRTVHEIAFFHIALMESSILDLLLEHSIHVVDHVWAQSTLGVDAFLRRVVFLLVKALGEVLVQV